MTFKLQGKEVILFGTDHNRSAVEDPMFRLMDSVIRSFNPTLILTEGNDNIASTREEAITKYGDFGLCQFIGFSKKIPTLNWDRSYVDIYNSLHERYSSKDIVFTILSLYNENYRQGGNYQQFYNGSKFRLPQLIF